MATYSLKLGTYSFPSTFHPSSVPADSRLGTAEVPRHDGVAYGVAYLGAKTINVRGMLRADTPTALRAAMDALLLAVNSGRQKLYLWDDRFIWANKVGFSTDYDETSFKRYCFVSVDFLCDSPFWEAKNRSSDEWMGPLSSGQTHDIVVGGNAYALPRFAIDIDVAGELAIELALGDSSFTLTGKVGTHDAIIVDCGEETVDLSFQGTLTEYDYMSQFDLIFFSLVANSTNRLTFTSTGTATVKSILTQWWNRWY